MFVRIHHSLHILRCMGYPAASEAHVHRQWTEVSKNLVTAPEGGYDIAPEGSGTRVTIYNVLEGHGPGKLIAPLALRSARKGADDFGRAIKTAVEAP